MNDIVMTITEFKDKFVFYFKQGTIHSQIKFNTRQEAEHQYQICLNNYCTKR